MTWPMPTLGHEASKLLQDVIRLALSPLFWNCRAAFHIPKHFPRILLPKPTPLFLVTSLHAMTPSFRVMASSDSLFPPF